MKLFSRKQEELVKTAESQPVLAISSSGVLERPVLTEKAAFLGEAGQYVFKVSSRATKPEVKKAVERIFGVKVEAVRIVNKKPKLRTWRGVRGRAAGAKKAIVKLVEGEKIEVLPK